MIKKVGILAISAVMLVMFSSPSMAASQIDFSGAYTAFYFNDVNYTRADDNEYRDSDSWFAHWMQIAVDFQATDEVSVHWAFRGPQYKRWGTGVGSNYNSGTNNTLITRHLYGKIVQDWGTVKVGRWADGVGIDAGLSALGYNFSYGGGWFLGGGIFNFVGPIDGISYEREWDNGFRLAAYYAKDNIDKDNLGLNYKDGSSDRFGIEPAYKWDGGGASLEISYVRDVTDPTVEKDYAIFLNPAVMQSWGDFSIHFEGKLGWGETTYNRALLNLNPTDDNKEKKAGIGAYLDVDYNYGPGNVTLASWIVGGSDVDSDKNKDLVGVGDFYPFLVAYNYNIIGEGYHSNVLGLGGYWSVNGYDGEGRHFDSATGDETGYDGDGNTNHWAIAILGNHSFTDDIKLNYGLGYFSLVKPSVRYATTLDSGSYGNLKDQEKDLGFEIDLGLTFNLLDNLTFETQFGYFFNGDALQRDAGWSDPDVNGIQHRLFKDAKDTYSWYNALTFSF